MLEKKTLCVCVSLEEASEVPTGSLSGFGLGSNFSESNPAQPPADTTRTWQLKLAQLSSLATKDSK
jgi:hypothetical protein